MYENILVPTDGSKGAKRGTEHAIDLARTEGATVHVLHVLDQRIHGDTPALSSDEVFLEEMEHEGTDIMEEVREKAEGNGVDVKTQSVRGVPYEEILNYAEDNDIDVIVMGKHGQSERGKPHVGSSTDRVLRLSPTTVVSV